MGVDPVRANFQLPDVQTDQLTGNVKAVSDEKQWISFLFHQCLSLRNQNVLKNVIFTLS